MHAKVSRATAGIGGQRACFNAGTETIPKNSVIGQYWGELVWYDELMREQKVGGEKLEKLKHAITIEHIPIRDRMLAVDAFGKGNETSAINDRKGLNVAPNCMFVEVAKNGWPYVFVISIADIPPNTEILIEYGERYWGEHGEECYFAQPAVGLAQPRRVAQTGHRRKLRVVDPSSTSTDPDVMPLDAEAPPNLPHMQPQLLQQQTSVTVPAIGRPVGPIIYL